MWLVCLCWEIFTDGKCAGMAREGACGAMTELSCITGNTAVCVLVAIITCATAVVDVLLEKIKTADLPQAQSVRAADVFETQIASKRLPVKTVNFTNLCTFGRF